MRALLIALSVFTAQAQAAVDLGDESILGLYKLETPDKNSELKKAELVYNQDNKLVVQVDRNEAEYELSGPDKNGVVYEGDDEPNCGGEEQKCWYDLETVIKLKTVKIDGEAVPQLQIAITQANAWDEEGVDTYTETYVLNWNKKLAHAIPFYTNIENPPALKSLVAKCGRELENLSYEDGARYTNANDICPYPFSVKLREPFAKSLEQYLKTLRPSEGNPPLQKVTPAQLKAKVFNPARALAKKYSPTKPGAPTRAQVLDQIDRVEEYTLEGDEFFTYKYLLDGVIVVIDTKKQTISRYGIKVTNKYK